MNARNGTRFRPRAFLGMQFGRADEPLRQIAIEELETAGFQVETGANAGIRRIDDVVLQRLRRSQWCILIFTPRQLDQPDYALAGTSPWVLQESGAAVAFRSHIRILKEDAVPQSEIGGLQGFKEHVTFTRRRVDDEPSDTSVASDQAGDFRQRMRQVIDDIKTDPFPGPDVEPSALMDLRDWGLLTMLGFMIGLYWPIGHELWMRLWPAIFFSILFAVSYPVMLFRMPRKPMTVARRLVNCSLAIPPTFFAGMMGTFVLAMIFGEFDDVVRLSELLSADPMTDLPGLLFCSFASLATGIWIRDSVAVRRVLHEPLPGPTRLFGIGLAVAVSLPILWCAFTYVWLAELPAGMSGRIFWKAGHLALIGAGLITISVLPAYRAPGRSAD